MPQYLRAFHPKKLEKRAKIIYNRDMVEHPFPPVFSPTSKKLILGSFPSVASRGVGFYYGNPRNRFYRVLTGVFSDELPETNEEKRSYILSHSLALWDVVASRSEEHTSELQSQ